MAAPLFLSVPALRIYSCARTDPLNLSNPLIRIPFSVDACPAANDTQARWIYFRVIFTALATVAGVAHSGVLKVFAVARALPALNASPAARPMLALHG